MDNIEQFWKTIWCDKKEHNKEATWISSEVTRMRNTTPMEDPIISTEDIRAVTKKLHSWKATGPDHVHNYWLKKFTSTHRYIAKLFTEILNDIAPIPEFMTEGRTFLLPKDKGNTTDPSNYRPITCLCTVYKLLTACIAQKIYTHLENNRILSIEQKGCIKKSQGCKEQLIIDSIIMEEAYQKKRNIFTAYIDYKKAFDSVPHTWLIEILRIYKVSGKIIRLVSSLMQSWRVNLYMNQGNDMVTSNQIPIKCGILQGDSLSPLWFCMAVNPLSTILNETKYGFLIKGEDTQHKISHLLYMDDIKLYGSRETHIKYLLNLTEQFTRDIKMTFGLDKCRRLSVVNGNILNEGFELNEGLIESMSERDSYKYLGLAQGRKIHHKNVINKVSQAYKQRVRDILKSCLSGRNMTKAINAYAIPVLSFTFGVIKWSTTELEAINRESRKLFTKFRIHHPRSAIERVYLPRNMAGRGILDITQLCQNQVKNLKQYFLQQDSELHKAINSADDNYTPLQLQRPESNTERISRISQLKQLWKDKAIHGRYPNMLDQPHIDMRASNMWLMRGNIFAETEGFMVAIQDQVISTKNYLKYVVKNGLQDDSCRRCRQKAETIQHITGACPSLAGIEYLQRHNMVARIVHQAIGIRTKLLENEMPYYRYIPEVILENERHKIYWDRTVFTDRTVPFNRPDIIHVDKDSRKASIIDIGIPNDHNILDYYMEKKRKYTQLAEEMKHLWHIDEVKIIPIIVSTTGIIPKSLERNLVTLGIKHKMVTIQKAVILATTTIVRTLMGTSI